MDKLYCLRIKPDVLVLASFLAVSASVGFSQDLAEDQPLPELDTYDSTEEESSDWNDEEPIPQDESQVETSEEGVLEEPLPDDKDLDTSVEGSFESTEPAETSTSPKASDIESDPVVSTPRSNRIFGKYRLHLGGSVPEFEAQDNYEKVYKNSSIMWQFGVDYFFYDWYATLGFTMRAGIMTDKGCAVPQGGTSGDCDLASEKRLVIFPLQMGPTFQMTPFSGMKWMVLSGFAAGEVGYFSEVSDDDLTEEEEEAAGGKTITLSGRRYGLAMGLMLSLAMTPLEPSSAASLRNIGLNEVYLSPFVEFTQPMDGEEFNLARRQIGIMFTFESL